VQNNHENVFPMGNVARRLRKDREATRSNGGPDGCQVEPAGPTLVSAGVTILGFDPLFWKPPPPPLRSHLGPWLSWFDPTTHAHPTGL